MRSFCHRCHGDLTLDPAESSFCPHCGAPQFRVIEDNVVALPATPLPGAADTTGKLPPPAPGSLYWATVIPFAAIIAAIATALMAAVFLVPAAFPIAWLWTVSGAVIVLGLYQRRHPETLLNAAIGARVGIVYGVLAVSAMAVLVAISGIVARFGLHHMGSFDVWITNAMHQAMEQQIQQLQSSGQADPALDPNQMRAFFYSPEVRAGMSLAMLSVSAAFLIGFSALGGAVGGLLRTRRR